MSIGPPEGDQRRPSSHASGGNALHSDGWPADSGARRDAVYAALDLGTNNCRLLVARPSRHGFRVVDAFSRIVRLGEGLGSSTRLGAAAMDRTIEALKVCRDKISFRGVTRARFVTTEACRAAENGNEFLERVRAETGLVLEVLDGKEEAHLAAAGCSILADRMADNVIIFDIGGGSTEIVWLRGARGSGTSTRSRVAAWASLTAGVVTLAERHGGMAVSAESFEAMVQDVAAKLADFAREAAPALRSSSFHLLGTSGTVTTLAGLHLGLARYDRRQVDGLWMNDRQVDRVLQRLLAMPYSERAANGCIGSERADLVLPGCAIFEAIRRAFPSRRVRIADRGLREGILVELMRADGAWDEGGRV
ncbi:MAG: Ppx/GppA family phosphatase [Proteobacteria bacterium]|nr:Ppx/GppA family phosphatase [Pseudomonadota bacterium]